MREAAPTRHVSYCECEKPAPWTTQRRGATPSLCLPGVWTKYKGAEEGLRFPDDREPNARAARKAEQCVAHVREAPREVVAAAAV